jgi:signal transduction histidine kinase
MTDNQRIGAASGHTDLAIFQKIILATGTILDLKRLQKQLVDTIVEVLPCDCAIILTADDDKTSLIFGESNLQSADHQVLEAFTVSLYNAGENPIIQTWLQGKLQQLTAENTGDHRALQWLTTTFPFPFMMSAPLINNNTLIGVLICGSQDKISDTLIETTSRATAVALHNGRTHTKTVQQAEAHLRELTILRQIDRELNDTIEPQHVFSMTLDWALRFTNAQAASIGLYDQNTDELRIIADYGYDIPTEQIIPIRMQRGGIGHRIARSGHSEIIPDVSMDKDFIRGASLSQSQMSVPVMREDRVIAVINVESKKLNGFTDEHLDFVEKLAARAGVAIDNARLFDTTEREREKLSHILNTTADIVIAFGLDERLILMNPAAFSALRLYAGESHIGRPLREILAETALLDAFERAETGDEPAVEEIELPNGRIYHMNLTRHENVGWIIVMHDITLFKEMDLLKSELIATVSHDLKQPLAVMNGYIELLMMHRKLDETGLNFVEMTRKSVHSMRQLIDDLLDLAKIESGIQLNPEPVDMRELVTECIDSLQPAIATKNMTMDLNLPADLPMLLADRSRLQQILLNLIGNAVKYTQPEGQVRLIAENRERAIRILIQDNGMGISPEDQAHIFERFYRVRRPETDSIEGTGLGLAIVKSLVEAHNGKIGLESRLGEGTTFYLTLPTIKEKETVSA